MNIPGPLGSIPSTILSTNSSKNQDVTIAVASNGSYHPRNDSSLCDPALLTFNQSAWKKLCSVYGISFEDDVFDSTWDNRKLPNSSLNANSQPHIGKQSSPVTVSMIDQLKALGIASLADLAEGIHDFEVPRLAVVVRHISEGCDGSWRLLLADPSGETTAIMTNEVAAANPGILIPGSAVMLEKVPVFVARQPCRRILCLHARAVAAVFTAVNNGITVGDSVSDRQP